MAALRRRTQGKERGNPMLRYAQMYLFFEKGKGRRRKRGEKREKMRAGKRQHKGRRREEGKERRRGGKTQKKGGKKRERLTRRINGGKMVWKMVNTKE